MLPASEERVFALVGGVNGLVSPPALLAGVLFISRPAESRPAELGPALDLWVVPAPRSPTPDAFVPLPPCTAATWFCCIDCRSCAVCCWNDAGRAVFCVPKKRCAPALRMVEGAAARPLADKLACVGTTGRFPAIMRAPLSCSPVAATALTRPAPKCPAFTVDNARPMCGSLMCATLENRVPPCSGAKPPW
jgi:hypothetical protein